jgi:hypothetical protein
MADINVFKIQLYWLYYEKKIEFFIKNWCTFYPCTEAVEHVV